MTERQRGLIAMGRCPWCGDEIHAPGQSYRSNCGDSEVVVHPRGYLASALEPANAYVPGRVYERRGLLRRRRYAGGIGPQRREP